MIAPSALSWAFAPSRQGRGVVERRRGLQCVGGSGFRAEGSGFKVVGLRVKDASGVRGLELGSWSGGLQILGISKPESLRPS